MTKLKVKEKLTSLYNEVNVSNEEYVRNLKEDEFFSSMNIDVDLAYALKAGALLGGIKAILEMIDE